jgi:hypothetical protein
MVRPLRVQFSAALYHVTARGNGRKPIFRDERQSAGRGPKVPQPVPVRRRAGTQRLAISNRRLVSPNAGWYEAALERCRSWA